MLMTMRAYLDAMPDAPIDYRTLIFIARNIRPRIALRRAPLADMIIA